MRRSLLPSAVPQPSGAAQENTAAIPLTKLARARNSIVPPAHAAHRQPLAAVTVQQPPAQTQTQTAQLGHKRASAAFATQDEQRPTKLSRSSLAPAPVGAQATPQSQSQSLQARTTTGGVAPLPSPSQATELSVDCIPGYDVRMLQGAGGQLLSFEEVRAMHPRYAIKKKIVPLHAHGHAPTTAAAPMTTVPAHSAPLAPLHSPTAAAGAAHHASHRGSHFTPDHSAHMHNQSLSHPSPTVCTRAAIDDIDAMFKDQSPAPSAVVTPGARGGLGGFAAAAGPPVPFSTRSLTKEIPPMHDGAATGSGSGSGGIGGGAFGLGATDYSRGRPSPVAFTVFTDEEMQTRNVASAAAAAQALQNNRAKGVGLCVFVDPDLENQAPAAAAAPAPAPAPAPAASSGGFGGARRQALAARAPEPAAVHQDEDEDDEDDYSGGNSSKSYPPLTPIAEVNESDMSHASSTSATPGLTGATGAQAQAAAFAAAQALARQQEEESAAAAAAEELAAQGILDAFDPAQRVAWINELGTLSSPLVTDLTAQAAPFLPLLPALAAGTETQVEVGDSLFQVSSVVAPHAGWVEAAPEERCLTLVAENLLEGGESCLRLGSVSELMEAQSASALLTRLLANDPSSEALIRSLFLLPTQALVYEDACCIVAPTTPRGTMASLLASYARAGAKMDPRLAVYYCFELLKLLQILHVNQMLHNNLSPHTVWIRFDDDAATAWSDVWSAEGEGGWQGKGVALGDFGAAIDRTLFPAETSFRCANPRVLGAFPAMALVQGPVLAAPSWAEAVDLVALCQLAYAMLFPGEELGAALQRDASTGAVVVARAFPPGLHSDVMKPLFDTVLNFSFEPRGGAAGAQACADLLAQLIQHFETAISMDQPNGQPTIAQCLKQLLQKQQLMMLNTKK